MADTWEIIKTVGGILLIAEVAIIVIFGAFAIMAGVVTYHDTGPERQHGNWRKPR